MSLWQQHIAVYAVLFALGSFLLIWSFFLRPARYFSALRQGTESSGSPVWAALVAGMGSGLLLYMALLIVDNHGVFILSIMSSKGGDASTLVTIMLGLLGVVMTMITVAVISVSDRATQRMQELHSETLQIQGKYRDEIRGYTDKVKKHHEEIESQHRDIIDLGRGHKENIAKIRLQQIRLFLLYQNERELDLYDPDEDRPDWVNFREPLAIVYAKGSDKELLEYLVNYYHGEEMHRELLVEEKDYLKRVEEYYKEHKLSQYDETLSGLFETLEKKIGFRS